MNYHILNVVMDAALLVGIVWRIEHEGIFESGAMLRVSVLVVGGWALIGDTDYYLPGDDYFPFATIDHPMRVTVIILALLIGTALDIFRSYMRHKTKAQETRYEKGNT